MVVPHCHGFFFVHFSPLPTANRLYFMLYLFDIDGTLVDTGGAGMAALKAATYQIFGHEGPPLDLAGSTDLGVVAHIHHHFEIEHTRERFEAYIDVYLQSLEWHLTHGGFPGRVYEGVPELLQQLSQSPDATVGLLTGNAAGGAAAKMRHFHLSDHFAFGAYGCDHADRNQLGPIALKRATAHRGKTFSPRETWVIGDTPKDIACAHAMGARCLAVATGSFTAAQLKAHHADQVVEDLTQRIDWI
jgi:phosphoglycolate phosphatase